MRKDSRIVALLLAVVMCTLSGCGLMEKEFDAGAYVKATLDCLYKAEYDEYVKLTDAAKEEAVESYEEMLDENVAALKDLEMSDELLAGYRKYFADVHAKTKYSVKETVKDENGNYKVTMEVFPIDYMAGVSEQTDTKFDAYVQEVLDAGTTLPTEAEQTEKYYALMLDTGVEILENVTYGDAVLIEVNVVQDSEGVYEIQENDLVKLTEALFVL